MRIILALLVLFASLAYGAGPYQPIDVVPGVTSCNVSLDTGPKTSVVVTPPKPPDTQNRCYYDLATYPVGSHTMISTSVQTDPKWGTLEGDPSNPFVLVRPARPPIPVFEPVIIQVIP
jgi:hypothetical protein